MAKKNSLVGRKVTFNHGGNMVGGKVEQEKGDVLVVRLNNAFGGGLTSVHRKAVSIG